jgi:Cof subfamily protein (haloacid dehalogenase superfamily)
MIQLVASDLDGTLLPHNGSFHPHDIEALHQLGMQGITRVIATGRSLFSAQKALDADFPIDYLVFSSGAGVFSWKEQKLLYKADLGFDAARSVCKLLQDSDIAFTIHEPVPHNHCFSYWSGTSPHPDFARYIDYHHEFTSSFIDIKEMDYAQILGFIDDVDQYQKLSAQLSGIKTVRATSPIDGKSIWMEFLHPDVSKAKGVNYVCDLLGINVSEVAVLGNDFNDVDLLTAFEHAFVVDNAPNELKQVFQVMPSVHHGPLSHLHASILTSFH